MSDAPLALTLEFLDWFVAGPRPYREIMLAWRTSCPRHAIFEDAIQEGLVRRTARTAEPSVELTDEGWAFVRKHRHADPQSSTDDRSTADRLKGERLR
jgi:hypothetical protein